MQRKNVMKLLVSAMFVVTTVCGLCVGSLMSKPDYSKLVVDNVEALTGNEQPNVADCVPDPDYTCEALHPTDSTKDVKREYARWE